MSDIGMELGLAETIEEKKPEKVSELLRHVSDRAGEKISLGQIAEAMGERSFGAFLLVFCLPNLLPLPPGATFILGLPLVFVAFQMLASRLDTIWLPKRLYNYSFDNKAFSGLLDKMLPSLQRVERLITPRFWPSRPRLFERLIGLFALFLAIVVFLPVPFGNMGPSYALALMGLGITERDGIVFSVGAAIGIIFTFIVTWVGYEIIAHIPYFIDQIPLYWHSFWGFFY
jgi:hypothetical protein